MDEVADSRLGETCVRGETGDTTEAVPRCVRHDCGYSVVAPRGRAHAAFGNTHVCPQRDCFQEVVQMQFTKLHTLC